MKDLGGGCRSRRTRLWEGFRIERRVAVARPMPEDPPVMRMVFGVDFRVWRADIEGEKRAMFGSSGRLELTARMEMDAVLTEETVEWWQGVL